MSGENTTTESRDRRYQIIIFINEKLFFSSSLAIQNLGAGINNNGFQSENDQILVENKGFYYKS